MQQYILLVIMIAILVYFAYRFGEVDMKMKILNNMEKRTHIADQLISTQDYEGLESYWTGYLEAIMDLCDDISSH